jgi:CO/xanthine dehydrogenase Mo-binding subunit
MPDQFAGSRQLDCPGPVPASAAAAERAKRTAPRTSIGGGFGAADLTGEGGGLPNYSASVGLVAAAASIGIYNIPKVDVTSVVFATPVVPAGSMRGYGTLQSMTRSK